MYTRPFHENTFFLEIQDAQSELLVLGPIETNVRKCVFSQICLLPLELDPPHPLRYNYNGEIGQK